MAMKRVSTAEAARISELVDRLGSTRFRTLITSPDSRLIRPDRLSNLREGRGKLSTSEREALGLVSTNSVAVENLARKNSGKRPYKVNRAIRNWLLNGKEKGVDYKEQEADIRERQLNAIKALRFLGIDPSEGTYYVRKRKL